ncbi:MAG: hypothetical protein IJ398_04145 [Clostridia bacterium]|nr:hypothetical protein [Clostridia bacterium]
MVGIFAWFRKRKELKLSQKYHEERKAELEAKNSRGGLPLPKDWINEEYHMKVIKKQKELKRVLTKEELKQLHKDTTNDVLDFVDKHLFKIS